MLTLRATVAVMMMMMMTLVMAMVVAMVARPQMHRCRCTTWDTAACTLHNARTAACAC